MGHMVNIERLRTTWSGTPGGAGVTTIYASSVADMRDDWIDFLEAMKSYLPNNVSLSVENSGDSIDVETGDLTGGWSTGAVETVTGLNASPWAAPVGFQTVWETGSVVGGRRLKGRTYWVPATGTMYDDTGTLDDTLRGEVASAASTFVAAVTPSLLVWQRPRAARAATADLPALAARVGGFAAVSSASVPDKTVVLTSRRD